MIGMQNVLLKKDNFRSFTPLDCLITQKRFLEQFLSWKNKTSAGFDGFRNDMFKTGQHILIPYIVKLFNIFLSQGIYPDDWRIGYIKPLYKKR